MRSSWLAGLLVAAFVSVAHAAAVQPQSQEQSPTNDNFANAAVLANTANATMGSLYYATHEVGEARYSKTSLRNTVWYKFTATQTGRAVALLTTASTDQVPLQLHIDIMAVLCGLSGGSAQDVIIAVLTAGLETENNKDKHTTNR